MTVAIEPIEDVILDPVQGGTYAFGFDWWGGGNLAVTLFAADGSVPEIALEAGTGWTATPATRATGGTLTLLADPGARDRLRIRRRTAVAQEFDAPPTAQGFEAALDRVVMQQQEREADIDTVLRLPLGLSGLQLPNPGAGQLIGWNGDGSGLRLYQLEERSASQVTVTGGTTARPLADKLGEALSVFDRMAPGLITRVVMRTATPADAAGIAAGIQATYDHLKTSGGGVLYLPRGLYLVGTPLQFDGDGVHVVGDGPEATTIRTTATDGLSPVIIIREQPQENGVTKVFDGSLKLLTIDGNFPGQITVDGQSAITCSGISNWVFEDLHIRNAGHYGIGFQNGGYDRVICNRLLIDNVNMDGIDVKDNGSISRAFTFTNIEIRNWGKRDIPSARTAALDVGSRAPFIDNIRVTDFGALGTPGAAVRLKQGIASTTRGWGGERAIVGAIYVEQTDPTATDVRALDIRVPYCAIGGVFAMGLTGYAVLIDQPFNHIGSLVAIDCAGGVSFIGASVPSDQAFPGGDHNHISRLVAIDCTTGVFVNRRGNVIESATMTDCVTGFQDGNSVNRGPMVIGSARFENVTTPWSVTQPHHIGNVIGAEGPLTAIGNSGGLPTDMQFYAPGDRWRLFTGYAGDRSAAVEAFRVIDGGAVIELQARGAGANTDLRLSPRGTGRVQFGTYTAGAPTVTGYVEIVTAAGQTIRLAGQLV